MCRISIRLISSCLHSWIHWWLSSLNGDESYSLQIGNIILNHACIVIPFIAVIIILTIYTTIYWRIKISLTKSAGTVVSSWESKLEHKQKEYMKERIHKMISISLSWVHINSYMQLVRQFGMPVFPCAHK